MPHRLIRSFATAAALTLTAPVALHAQYAAPLPQYPPHTDYAPAPDQPDSQQPSAPVYDQAQLDQLLAPVALYPDQLLGQILMASTYPLEVVEASRWLQDPNHAALRGPALAQALDQLDWDPSVKSLVAFPSVLQMMDNQLEWTKSLGDAFLAQQADVMDSVQRLRHEALNNGTLQSNSQLVVTTRAWSMARGLIRITRRIISRRHLATPMGRRSQGSASAWVTRCSGRSGTGTISTGTTIACTSTATATAKWTASTAAGSPATRGSMNPSTGAASLTAIP
jgi:hypothetical protein